MQNRSAIAANKKAAQDQGKTPELLPLVGVNIAFSHTGLKKVSMLQCVRVMLSDA